MFEQDSPRKALRRAVIVAFIGYSVIFILFVFFTRGSTIDLFIDHQVKVADQAVRILSEHLAQRKIKSFEVLVSQRAKFDRIIKSLTYGLGISRLRLFDIDAELKYCTDQVDVRAIKVKDLSKIEKALQGLVQREMESRETESQEFEYFAPIRDGSGAIIGVAEIYFDVWSVTENLGSSTRNLIIISLLSFLLFTVVLFAYSLALFRKMETAREAQIKSQRQLQESQDMARVGVFVAGLAHQLKNPIAIILGLVNGLKKRESLGHQRDFIDGLDIESNRMSALVEKFLRFARPLRQQQSPKQANVRDCFNKVTTLVQKESPSVKFECSVDSSLMVEAPEELMIELFDVLVRNSIGACNNVDIPRIKLSGAITNHSVRLVLEDNGRGLTKELQMDPELAFQPFFTTKTNGSGLGLALAKRIIEECQGTIRIGQGVEEGAKVELVLPMRIH